MVIGPKGAELEFELSQISPEPQNCGSQTLQAVMPYLLGYLCFSQVCYKANLSEGNSPSIRVYVILFVSAYQYLSFIGIGTVSTVFIVDMVPGRLGVAK